MAKHVLVFRGEEEDGVPQPETFRCCPLGLQFYAKDALPTYRVIELTIDDPGDGTTEAKPVDCSGVVVHSQYDEEKALFRTWVMFVDVPEETRQRFGCLARSSDFLCPHCENY